MITVYGINFPNKQSAIRALMTSGIIQGLHSITIKKIKKLLNVNTQTILNALDIETTRKIKKEKPIPYYYKINSCNIKIPSHRYKNINNLQNFKPLMGVKIPNKNK